MRVHAHANEKSILQSLLCLRFTSRVYSHAKGHLYVNIGISGPTLAVTCTAAPACHHLLQGVRHSKPTEVVDEVKAQLKEKVQPAGNPLADVIVAAGKDKLSKKPEDIQTDLTSERTPHSLTVSDMLHHGILLP